MLESLSSICAVREQSAYDAEPSSLLDAKVDQVASAALCNDDSSPWGKVIDDLKNAFFEEKEAAKQSCKNVQSRIDEQLQVARKEFDAECERAKQAYNQALAEAKEASNSASSESQEACEQYNKAVERAEKTLNESLEKAQEDYKSTLDRINRSLEAAKQEAEK